MLCQTVGGWFGWDGGPAGLNPAVSVALSKHSGTLVVKLYAPCAISLVGVSNEREFPSVKSAGQMKRSQHRILVLVVRLRAAKDHRGCV